MKALLSWIISSHFSSGWAKNNTGIAFLEYSYSLLAGTEKVRRMRVRGRSHSTLFVSVGLDEIYLLVRLGFSL